MLWFEWSGTFHHDLITLTSNRELGIDLTGLENSAVQLTRTRRFSSWQVTFHSHFPDRQWPREVTCQLYEKKVN